MVEFCKHFGVWHRWQQPEGVPDGAGVKKKKHPQRFTAPLWCGPMATARIWQLSDTGLAAEPTASCLGPSTLTRRKWEGGGDCVTRVWCLLRAEGGETWIKIEHDVYLIPWCYFGCYQRRQMLEPEGDTWKSSAIQRFIRQPWKKCWIVATELLNFLLEIQTTKGRPPKTHSHHLVFLPFLACRFKFSAPYPDERRRSACPGRKRRRSHTLNPTKTSGPKLSKRQPIQTAAHWVWKWVTVQSGD